MKFKHSRVVTNNFSRAVPKVVRASYFASLAIVGLIASTLAHGAGKAPADFIVWRPQTG